MGVGQLSESDAVDALRLPFYSSSHPTGSHGWRNQFDLGNPDVMDKLVFEIRQLDDPTRESPGRLTGTLLNYEERARDRHEVFARGALTWPEAGILVNWQHDRSKPILRAVPFLDGDAVKIDAQIPNTALGRDTVVNIREGVFGGLSVEFHSRSEGRRGNLREIRSAFLGPAALVDTGSYAGATVEVRAEAGVRAWAVEDVLRWL